MSNFEDPTTPEEVNELLDRLTFTNSAVDLPFTVGQDTDTVLEPRSMKMTDAMYRRVSNRAVNLGMSASAYLRSLIERDLAQAEGKGDPSAQLSRIAAELSRAAAEVDRVASKLSHTA